MGKQQEKRLRTNNIAGWMFEKQNRRYYRLRGDDFSRFPDKEAVRHDKRARIDKNVSVEVQGEQDDGFVFTLVHPKWPKVWRLRCKDANEARYWIRAFGIAGANVPKISTAKSPRAAADADATAAGDADGNAVSAPAIHRLDVDYEHLDRISGDRQHTYYRVKEEGVRLPNVAVPVASDAPVRFTCTRNKTVPIVVAVHGITERNQELSLNFLCDGERLKAGTHWSLNGQKVRSEEIDGKLMTLVTLLVSISFYEPPSSRINVVARIKNTDAMQNIFIDVVHKLVMSDATLPPPKKPAQLTSAPSTPPPQQEPETPFLIGIGLDRTACDLVGRDSKRRTYLRCREDQESGKDARQRGEKVVWGCRVRANANENGLAPEEKGQDVQVEVEVKLRCPFPVLVVADGTEALSLSLAVCPSGGGKPRKLRAGQDWQLHSQQAKHVENAETRITLFISLNANVDVGEPIQLVAGIPGEKGKPRRRMFIMALAINHPTPDDLLASSAGSVIAAKVRAEEKATLDAEPLPPGWKEAKAPNGRVYFYNKSLGKTSWTRPMPMEAKTPPGSPRADAFVPDAADELLPDDWERRTSAAGKPYYALKGTAQSSWTPPPGTKVKRSAVAAATATGKTAPQTSSQAATAAAAVNQKKSKSASSSSGRASSDDDEARNAVASPVKPRADDSESSSAAAAPLKAKAADAAAAPKAQPKSAVEQRAPSVRDELAELLGADSLGSEDSDKSDDSASSASASSSPKAAPAKKPTTTSPSASSSSSSADDSKQGAVAASAPKPVPADEPTPPPVPQELEAPPPVPSELEAPPPVPSEAAPPAVPAPANDEEESASSESSSADKPRFAPAQLDSSHSASCDDEKETNAVPAKQSAGATAAATDVKVTVSKPAEKSDDASEASGDEAKAKAADSDGEDEDDSADEFAAKLRKMREKAAASARRAQERENEVFTSLRDLQERIIGDGESGGGGGGGDSDEKVAPVVKPSASSSESDDEQSDRTLDHHGKPLPDGWLREKSSAGRTFYSHKKTGKTSFAVPTATQADADGGKESKKSEKKEKKAKAKEEKGKAAADDDEEEEELGENGLPKGWKKAVGPNGIDYYYHSASGKTQWDKPTLKSKQKAEASESDSDSLLGKRATLDSSSGSASGRGGGAAVAGRATAASDGGSDSSGEGSAEFTDSSDAEAREMMSSSGEESSDDQTPLPVGWSEARTKDGEKYYFHAATGESSWVRPTKAVEVKLPSGWKQATTKDGAIYYYNKSTGQTSWTVPKE